MHFHSQNLNEKPHGRTGWKLRYGRAWLRTGDYHRGLELRWEWHFLRSNSWGLELSLADHEDDAVGGHIALGPLFALYWGFGWPRLRAWMERLTSRESAPHEIDQCRVCGQRKDAKLFPFCAQTGHMFVPRTYWSSNGRNIGIAFHDATLWINLWNDPMEYRSKDPKWWHFSVNLPDLILGSAVHDEGVVLEQQHVQIPMPEGGYWATVTLREETWTRPRWRPRRLTRAHIEMDPDQQIPCPGKGENAWDCGEDATFGLTCAAKDVVAAMCKMTESVLGSRVRYGGHNWRPAEKKRA